VPGRPRGGGPGGAPAGGRPGGRRPGGLFDAPSCGWLSLPAGGFESAATSAAGPCGLAAGRLAGLTAGSVAFSGKPLLSAAKGATRGARGSLLALNANAGSGALSGICPRSCAPDGPSSDVRRCESLLLIELGVVARVDADGALAVVPSAMPVSGRSEGSWLARRLHSAGGMSAPAAPPTACDGAESVAGAGERAAGPLMRDAAAAIASAKHGPKGLGTGLASSVAVWPLSTLCEGFADPACSAPGTPEEACVSQDECGGTRDDRGTSRLLALMRSSLSAGPGTTKFVQSLRAALGALPAAAVNISSRPLAAIAKLSRFSSS